jgi:hypothetical protein
MEGKHEEFVSIPLEYNIKHIGKSEEGLDNRRSEESCNLLSLRPDVPEVSLGR